MVGTRDASESSGKIALRKEEAMDANDNVEPRTRLVLVVGVDLSEVSPHLLATARSLVRSVDEAELHVVHVVHSESVVQRLSEPPGSVGVADRAQKEAARWELERLCGVIVEGAAIRVVVHTPVGHPAREINRIASEVGAGIIVIEAHDHPSKPRRLLHRSVVARIARTAPCSVLTVRPGPQSSAANGAGAKAASKIEPAHA
jgi:nucleotide-binding universal stress UspA family protein